MNHDASSHTHNNMNCKSSPSQLPFSVHEKIGTGTFSEIYRITFLEGDTASFALKLLSPHQSHLADNEMDALKHLPSHPNIVKCVDRYNRIQVLHRIWDAIVLEYASSGDLYSLISNKGKLSEETARRYYKQIRSALAASHSVHVYHRDIKLENILIGRDENILICDWGLASVNPTGVDHTTTLAGTVPYMDPDMFAQNNTYSLKRADLWAALCAFFICVVGHPPFTKAHFSDYHYSKMLTKPEIFWRSIGKYNLGKKKYENISFELVEFFTKSFQRNGGVIDMDPW